METYNKNQFEACDYMCTSQYKCKMTTSGEWPSKLRCCN